MTHRRWLAATACFLLAAVAVLGVGVLLAARIIRRPDYAAHIGDPSIMVQERPFLMHGQRCDVLIDGDSTASTGIDPRVITQETGLSACNIASTRPVWDATGTFPLDHFLANNPSPKILILQFGPEIFYRTTDWEHIPALAPYALLLRQASPAYAWRTILLHPVQTVQVLQVVFKGELFPRSPAETERVRGIYLRTAASFDESHGRLNLELPALQHCDSRALELFGPLDSAWIGELRRRYTARGMVTVVNASPIPACDPQLGKFEQELGPYVDANVRGLPVGLFVGGDRHMTAEGARYEAALLAAQIQNKLAPAGTSGLPK